MRIENVSGQKFISPSAQGADKASLPQMKRGDSFTARVLEANQGSATLRLESGQVIKARVEDGAQLTAGQDVEMQVAGNDEGTLTLRVIETLGGEAEAAAAPNPSLAARPGGGRQEAAAASLKSLNLPVTRETVAATLRIMDKFPEIGPDKAAFLAASGIPEEMLTPNTVARLFAADAGDLLAQLSGLLDEAAQASQTGPAGQPAPAEQAVPQPAGTPQQPAADTPAAQAAPVAEASQPAEMPASPAETQSPPASPAPAQAAAEAVIPGQAAAEAVTAQAARPAVRQEADSPPPESAQAAIRDEASPQSMGASDRAPAADSVAQAMPDSAQVTARLGEAVELVRRFAENPQIFASGEGRAAAFAQMFQQAAAQVAQIISAPAEEQAALLKAFIDDMFVRIDRWSDDAPALVKKAREELLTRLTLVQEAVTGSNLGNRAEVARQARGLAEHVRLLEEIGQFGYVQIPVSQGGRQKTAEMYIYRDKRRAKRIDADNVKILLALDTQSMGHLQAFVSIRQKEVSVRLDVGRQQWADYIRMRSPELHSMLAEAGYRLTENRIGVREEPVTVEKAMAALLQYDARPAGLDVKV